MASISKTDLVTHISCSSGVDKATVRKIFDSSLEAIKTILEAGQEVRLIGFGSFVPQKSKERQGLNLHTKEKITIPATTRLRFRTSQELKDRISKTTARSAKTSHQKKTVQPKTEQVKATQTEKRKTLTLQGKSKNA